jgi:hypothetical protein
MSELTWSFNIAGVQFHDYKGVVNEMKAGDKLEMIPEPTNKFDPNAVQLHFTSKSGRKSFIGFVPKKISADVSAFLEHADDPVCVLTEVIPSAKPWQMFMVKVTDGAEEMEDEDTEFWDEEPDDYTPFPGEEQS